MTVVKPKNQKAQTRVPQKEGLILGILKTVQKQLNLRVKENIQKETKIDIGSLEKDYKEFINNNELII